MLRTAQASWPSRQPAQGIELLVAVRRYSWGRCGQAPRIECLERRAYESLRSRRLKYFETTEGGLDVGFKLLPDEFDQLGQINGRFSCFFHPC